MISRAAFLKLLAASALAETVELATANISLADDVLGVLSAKPKEHDKTMLVVSANPVATLGYLDLSKEVLKELFQEYPGQFYAGFGYLGEFHVIESPEHMDSLKFNALSMNLQAACEVREAKENPNAYALTPGFVEQDYTNVVYISGGDVLHYKWDPSNFQHFLITPSKEVYDKGQLRFQGGSYHPYWSDKRGVRWFTADTKDELKKTLVDIITGVHK